MPEATFRIRWPDGREQACYSPSTVIFEHLTAGERYTMQEFLDRCRKALDLAALRVEAKYGYRCTSADAQAAEIVATAEKFQPGDMVECLSIT
ncbi:MSMEG_0570 family nitrogen starvation response protein [Rhodobacterales bacterium HKCCE3408]|nr:MSMEG_0570 family nitrogen starvation response protein [Rhodobacterales bacterium HKCCE3408]